MERKESDTNLWDNEIGDEKGWCVQGRIQSKAEEGGAVDNLGADKFSEICD